MTANRVNQTRPPRQVRRLSGELMRLVLNRTTAKGVGLAILAVLVATADDHGNAEITMQEMAHQAHVSYESVRRWLRLLRKSGDLDVERRYGGHRANRYHLNAVANAVARRRDGGDAA